MKQLPRSVRRQMLLRSFAVQGSWNFQTLIGTGFAFMLLPALRHRFGKDSPELHAAVARHATLFNSHPYLASVAAGAVARLESDGTAPELTKRFKDALRGPLGSIGDRLFWVAWRPACALAGIALLLLGAPWWLAAVIFLFCYNALHLYVRSWGISVGLASGLQVSGALRSAALERWGNGAASAGALLAGFVTVLAISRVEPAPPAFLAVLLAGIAGLLLRGRARRAVATVLIMGWFAGLAGIFSPFG